MYGKIKGLSIAFLLVWLVAGCNHHSPASPQSLVSEAPVPKLPPLSTQEKIQAVAHWRLIAQHTANLVKRDLAANPSLRFSTLYVAPGGATPFEKVFYNLLITELFEEGMAVSNDPRNDLILGFDIELVNHPRRVIGVDPAVYHALGPGLIVRPGLLEPGAPRNPLKDYQVSRGTRLGGNGEDWEFTLPNNEIVITTSLTQEDHYVMRNSSVYYIDDPEWWQYARKEALTHPSMTNYTITDQ